MNDNKELVSIFLNGEEKHVVGNTVFKNFLEELGIKPENLVAEINGKILSRDAFGEYRLKARDHVEVISFVGGG